MQLRSCWHTVTYCPLGTAWHLVYLNLGTCLLCGCGCPNALLLLAAFDWWCLRALGRRDALVLAQPRGGYLAPMVSLLVFSESSGYKSELLAFMKLAELFHGRHSQRGQRDWSTIKHYFCFAECCASTAGENFKNSLFALLVLSAKGAATNNAQQLPFQNPQVPVTRLVLGQP